jgi:S1-C subfamily serine protease
MYSPLFRKLFVGLACAGMLAGSFYTIHAVRAAARPYLGIRLENTASETGPAGLTLGEVNPGGPAAKAGLKKGDRIVMAGGKEMKSYDDLHSVLAGRKPGDDLELKVMRDGKEQAITVKLGEAPANPVVAINPPAGAFLGVLSEKLTAEHRKQLGVKTETGVVVTQVLPESPAAAAGLHNDDVITHVGKDAVNSPEQLRDAIRKAGIGNEVVLKVARGQQEMEIKARLQATPAGADLPRLLPDLLDGHGHMQLPGLLQGLEKLPALEKKVQDLEKRVQELERKLNK